MPEALAPGKSAKRELVGMFKDGYTPEKRFQEKLYISAFVASQLYLLTRVWAFLPQDMNTGLRALIGWLSGMLVADFCSGLVHWTADTWGDYETPVIGKAFIRSFREHHVVPQAICNHDWIETNGDNCLAAATAFVICFAFIDNVTMIWFTIAWSWGLALTNQIHKWAHQFKPHWFVRTLQSLWIVLPRQHHAVHHRGQHDDYYCITTGWLDPLFSSLRLWRHLEWLVHVTTGAVPRADDQKNLQSIQRPQAKVN